VLSLRYINLFAKRRSFVYQTKLQLEEDVLLPVPRKFQEGVGINGEPGE
jgi:hypothetical protein